MVQRQTIISALLPERAVNTGRKARVAEAGMKYNVTGGDSMQEVLKLVVKKPGQGKSRKTRSYRIEGDTKTVPLDSRTAEAIAKQKQLFREKFGREPGSEDPLFFDLDASTPQFPSDDSQEKTWKALLQAAVDSGMPPAIVYAMNKTGRIVTEENSQFLTDAELQEWNDAVDEYHQKIESAQTQ